MLGSTVVAIYAVTLVWNQDTKSPVPIKVSGFLEDRCSFRVKLSGFSVDFYDGQITVRMTLRSRLMRA